MSTREPWLGPPLMIMTTMRDQIRFECTHGTTLSAANLLCTYLGRKKLRYATFYLPPYNDKAIVLKFSNSTEKENVLNHPNLEAEILAQARCKPYVNPNGPNPDKFHRMVFVYGLNPIYFHLLNMNDDGHDIDETLEGKVEAFKNQLKESQPDQAIEEFHFIQHAHETTGLLKPPRTVILTFKDLETAEAFLDEDTFFEMGMILKKNKRFHNHVQKKQCKICKKTDHRTGEQDKRICDRILRCPRCLSREHSTPTNTCIPHCWVHDMGHSSGSEKCPIIIKYKKVQRQMKENKEKIERQVENTAPDQVQFHRDILNLQNNFRNNPNSYASRVKGNNNPNNITNLNPNSTPGTSIVGTSFDATMFAAAYTAACINEAFTPGSFQTIMDEYAKMNNMAPMKHPLPRHALLKSLAPGAPAVMRATIAAINNNSTPVNPTPEPDSEDDDIPNINIPSFSGAVRSASSPLIKLRPAQRSPNSGANVEPIGKGPGTPKTSAVKAPAAKAVTTPVSRSVPVGASSATTRAPVGASPATTRQRSDLLNNRNHCTQVVNQTKENRVRINTSSTDKEFLEAWKSVDNISIEELNKFIIQGIFTVTPSKKVTKHNIPNINSVMIKDFAQKDYCKNKMVYYTLELNLLNDPVHCRNIMMQTQLNRIKLSTIPLVGSMIGDSTSMTVDKLNTFIAEGNVTMQPSVKPTVEGNVPNINRLMVRNFARNEELKNELVYFSLVISTISSL